MGNNSIDDLLFLINNEKDLKKIEFIFFEYLLLNDVSKDDLRYIYSCVDLKNKFLLRFFNFYFSVNNLKGIFNSSKNLEKYIDCLDNLDDFSDSYNMIVKEFVSLSRSLGCNNSLEVGILFALLLRKGIFSISKDNDDNIDNKVSLGRHYINLFYGNGVCLNYSDMLKDIYREFGYGSVNMLSNFSVLGDGDKEANHVVTLVEDSNVFYLFDSTFLTFFNCVNNEKAINVCGFGKLRLSPYLSSCVFANDKFSFDIFKSFCLKKNHYSLYDKNDFSKAYLKCIDSLEKNESLILDFSEKIKFSISDIVGKTKVKR